jgi:acetyltransferase-like isoleucine patch superfamily enzyme
VVEAGAVVNKDVEPNSRVGGIPAAKLETLGTPK